jgi:hypothetical protein
MTSAFLKRGSVTRDYNKARWQNKLFVSREKAFMIRLSSMEHKRE